MAPVNLPCWEWSSSAALTCGVAILTTTKILASGLEGYEFALAPYLPLGWTPRRITEGFFMRAESFFNFASYIDELAKGDSRILEAYGGRSLHQQSHGESFLSLFITSSSQAFKFSMSRRLLCLPRGY